MKVQIRNYLGIDFVVCVNQSQVDANEGVDANIWIEGNVDFTVKFAKNLRVVKCKSLYARHAEIGGSLYASRAEISESLYARYAKIGKSLDASGARISQSLYASYAKIGKSIDVSCAKIGQSLGANYVEIGGTRKEMKADYFRILSAAPTEVPGLVKALREGRIDGSCYEDECCCLVGTLEKLAGKRVIERNGDSIAERIFFAIGPGMTPERNTVAHDMVEWAEEFLATVG